MGPTWSVGGSQQGAKIQILLSAPGAQGTPAPYTVTLAGGAAYLSSAAWEWDAAETASGQVRCLSALTPLMPKQARLLLRAREPLLLCRMCDGTVCRQCVSQISGAVTPFYTTMQPAAANAVNIGTIVTFQDSAALNIALLAVNGQPCSLDVTQGS